MEAKPIDITFVQRRPFQRLNWWKASASEANTLPSAGEMVNIIEWYPQRLIRCDVDLYMLSSVSLTRS
ncbi:MAG: hypothetical protein ACTS5P_01135 [Candidatus Hodgkinia cicadicola]